MKELIKYNEKLNNIRNSLKSTIKSDSLYDISVVLDNNKTNSKTSKEFIFLIDKISTNNEITNEILDEILKNLYEYNNILIEKIQPKSSNTLFPNFLNAKNIKSFLMMCVGLGIVFGIASSDTIILKILTTLGIVK